MSLALLVFWRNAFMRFVSGGDLQQQQTACTYCKIGRYDCGCPLFAELGKNLSLLLTSFASGIQWPLRCDYHQQRSRKKSIGIHACMHDVLNAAQHAGSSFTFHNFGAHVDIPCVHQYQLTRMHLLHIPLLRHDRLAPFSLYLCQHIASFLNFFLSRSS